MDESTILQLPYLETKKALEFTHCTHLKLSCHELSELFTHFRTCASKNDVIHIDLDNHQIFPSPF
ncbi:hypothetical protein HanRHA438_Chr08g0344791 [Helianthus annuus]|nr:hypothetical protein HanRHA438_Chr08g0344791 [Helianthus annuus]